MNGLRIEFSSDDLTEVMRVAKYNGWVVWIKGYSGAFPFTFRVVTKGGEKTELLLGWVGRGV